MQAPQLSLGQAATLACLLEATAPKVGNVHRSSDFENLTLHDFLASAVAIAPSMQSAGEMPVGKTVLEAIRATRQVVNTNTNLGIVLLLAPLAKALALSDATKPLSTCIQTVLNQLTPEDSVFVYEAIRLAVPGGLGKVEEMDVTAAAAPESLLFAMAAAADRDLIAQQYVTNFDLVLSKVVPYLLEGKEKGWTLTERIIRTHLRILSEHPDSLIVRKCGAEMATEISGYAAQILSMGEPGDEIYHGGLADFDFWLRSDGHRRNPGTTADLIAAGLFVGLVTQRILPPYQ